jgi:hypothetical protein
MLEQLLDDDLEEWAAYWRASARLPGASWGTAKISTKPTVGLASPCVEALARTRRRVWPPEGLPVL